MSTEVLPASLGSTSKFQVKDIVYRTKVFAVATGHWDGQTSLSLACRWYGEGIGYPQTYGKPQWMLLPGDVQEDIRNIVDPQRSELVLRFPVPQET